MTALAGERRAQLTSYGGEAARCGLISPDSAEALAGLLARASRAGRRITFRGGGCSFDTQALSSELVVSLDRLRGLHFSTDTTSVIAGSGVRWGELVREAHLRRCLPPVVVTTEQASVGGTTAGNCVSRWTPVRGPDSEHVSSLELVTARGQRLRLTRGDDELAGVTGGLGYLGAIASVELPLLANPHGQVETRVVAAGATEEVLAACAPARLPAASEQATIYGVLLPDLRRGMAYRSHHVSGQAPRPFLAVHQPRSLLRALGELLLLTHTGPPLVGELAYRLRRDRYVDPLLDYTFFMEGDARIRQLGRRLGFQMRIVQQAFVVPVRAAAELIERARRAFHAAAIVPMLADVLYSPADRALLSATYERGGFVVSFAFSPRTAGRLERIRAVLVQLSKVCLRLGGRVRLSKSVCADGEDLASMYAATLPRMRQLKRRLDPDGLLRNAFLERVFPSLL